jgi:hypothetical protein
MSISALSIDIIETICPYLDAPALAAVNSVSRCWKQQSDSPGLWDALFEKIGGKEIQCQVQSLTSRQFFMKHAVTSIRGVVAAARAVFERAPRNLLTTFLCDFSPSSYEIMARVEFGFYNYDDRPLTHKCYCFLSSVEEGSYFAHFKQYDAELAGWWDIRGTIPPSIKETLIADFTGIMDARFQQLVKQEREASSSDCRIL